jgi:predicted PurR-regulated permease PerM
MNLPYYSLMISLIIGLPIRSPDNSLNIDLCTRTLISFMTTIKSPLNTNGNPNPVIHYSLQLLALGLLLAWCFLIIEPFITPLVWALVLAATLYPAHVYLKGKLGNRNGLSAAIITILMLMLIIGPAVWLLLATVGEFRELGAAYRSGELLIPPPGENVKSWPLIGSKLSEYWMEASTNLTAFIASHSDQVKSLVLTLLDLLKTTGKGILVFTLSIVISGFLLFYSEPAGRFVQLLLMRIAGKIGESMVYTAGLTIRNVAKGIIGVAVIQAILAGIGMVLAGIPFAGVWILLCLLLAVMQIGLFPVSIGVIIYVWGHSDTTTAILLTIWMVFLGLIDNFLKPILMGKGAPVPMMVVFMGTIGGFIFSGFTGMFTGAIVLSLGYQLMTSWVSATPEAAQSTDTGQRQESN